MYGWIWRRLPGPLPVRLLTAMTVFTAVVLLLLFLVFPALDPHLPFNNVNVTKGGG